MRQADTSSRAEYHCKIQDLPNDERPRDTSSDSDANRYSHGDTRSDAYPHGDARTNSDVRSDVYPNGDARTHGHA